METQKKKVALGMSGGVDSSLAAKLLVDQGYEVTGVYLECWRAPGCRTEEDRQDALKVALSLGIPFRVLDFKQTYKDKVVEYFFNEYEAGRTPNPDVMCNKEIKFGLFYEWAMKNGFDYLATGHYAQILTDGQGQSYLGSSTDTHKDQTYFLYKMTQDQVEHTLFPIGHLTKTAVRQLATAHHLHVASKKDSVGICFIGDINVHEFLRERLGENPGDVVDTAGNVIGKHQGLWFYTVGQRHGFTIDAHTVLQQSDGTTINRHNIPPFYVIAKQPDTNHLVVGFGAETYQDHFSVQDIHWIGPTPTSDQPVWVRIRHTGQLYPAQLHNHQVKLAKPIQGLAAGQSAVFYTPHANTGEYLCLGGGIIA